MFNELSRHLREFRAAVQQHRYEKTDEGILFPRAHVMVRGLYAHRVNDGPWTEDHNLVPTEGLNYLLDQLLGGGSAAPLYLSLYQGAVTPAANWTAASYPATATEITSGSEGYSEGNRVLWNAAAAAAGAKDNYSNVAAFTIVTASQLTVNGVGQTTVNTKGATTGKLVSAARFSAARLLSNTDVFNVKYQIAMTST